MKRFQYEITRYPSEEFTTLVYSCTGDGTCSLSQVPPGQAEILEGMLNERGDEGWQLLQLIFRNDGIIAFWKREIDPDASTG
jgi:hypothetical protein